MQVNRCIGEISYLVAVAIALPHKVSIVDDILADKVAGEFRAGDTGASVRDAMLLDFPVDEPIAGCPAVTGVGANDVFVQSEVLVTVCAPEEI